MVIMLAKIASSRIRTRDLQKIEEELVILAMMERRRTCVD